MKLSKNTLDILTNFRQINKGLVFKAGNVIKTRHERQMMPIAKAVIEEEFPRDFAIYDLTTFLSVFNLLDNPELEFTDTHVVLTDDSKRSAKIKYAAPTMVVHMDYDIAVKLPSVDVSCEISQQDFKAIEKAASSFTAPEIAFVGDGKNIKLTTHNSNNSGNDSFEIVLGETDKNFTMIVNVANLQMPAKSYKIDICFQGIVEFNSLEVGNELTYWVAVSEKSKVN